MAKMVNAKFKKNFKKFGSKLSGKNQKPLTIDLNGKTLEIGKGFTRGQRKLLINQLANSAGLKGALAHKGINTLAGIAHAAQTTAVTMEGLGLNAEAQKLRTISRIVDDFMNDVKEMTPEQIQALNSAISSSSVVGGINKPTKPSIDGEPGGTIIV